LITDGNGKKLYQEDATRAIGTTLGSSVMDLGYDADGVADGNPGKNPITFQVVELDANNNVGSVLAGASHDAECLPASPNPSQRCFVIPPKYAVGTIIADTQLLQGPNVGPLGLFALTVASHQVIYRLAYAACVSDWIA